MSPELPDAVNEFVGGLVRGGAGVVWLAGSFARGEQSRYSDIDLGVIATHPARMQRAVVAGRLVSVSTTTEEVTRRSFKEPRSAGAAVPGWRRAVLLHDPDGTGKRLQDEAAAWTWEQVAAIDDWVASELTVLAEDVLKLCNGLERRDPPEAALRRNDVLNRAIRIAAVQERLLYDSESGIIEAVCEAKGESWRQALRLALALEPIATVDSMRAACSLFQALNASVSAGLAPEQHGVIDLALSAAAQRFP